jgi:peroxiredoxin family protein
MTVELFGFSHDDFIAGVDYAGAATFLPVAQKADVSLFM